MEEIWVDVENYEGYYQVSNLGRIRSLDRTTKNSNGVSIFRKGRILKPTKCSNGYLEAMFYKDGARKVLLIHRLVAKYFIENPDNLPEVNHKDETRDNNSVDNLEWCNKSYNNTYNNKHIKIGEKRRGVKLNISDEVRRKMVESRIGGNNTNAVRIKCLETGEEFECALDACNKYDISRATMSTDIKQGKKNGKTGLTFIKI